MNPEVAKAIPGLVERGILPPEKAPPLLRVARGELTSVRRELQALLYLGVLLILSGVGILVAENLETIGPTTITALLGLAAAACFLWGRRMALPFSWKEAQPSHFAYDYILLLGVALIGADLAFVEHHFTPLGENWPWHLLLVAVLAGLAAFRFDSGKVFALALSTFAAWRGVSVAHFGWTVLEAKDAVRWNAIGCGVLFAVLGAVLVRTGKKAHFESVASHLGWLLVLGGLASGLVDGLPGLAWASAFSSWARVSPPGLSRSAAFPSSLSESWPPMRGSAGG